MKGIMKSLLAAVTAAYIGLAPAQGFAQEIEDPCDLLHETREMVLEDLTQDCDKAEVELPATHEEKLWNVINFMLHNDDTKNGYNVYLITKDDIVYATYYPGTPDHSEFTIGSGAGVLYTDSERIFTSDYKYDKRGLDGKVDTILTFTPEAKERYGDTPAFDDVEITPEMQEEYERLVDTIYQAIRAKEANEDDR